MQDTARPPSRLRAELGVAHTPHVLVADGDECALEETTNMFRRSGFTVSGATDGGDAIRRLAEETIDVVVTDIVMPSLSGVDVLRALRSYDLDVPLIFLTGAPDLATARQAIELGAFRYLTKPIQSVQLIKTVERAIKLRAMARLKKDGLAMFGMSTVPGERAALEAAFSRALSSMWMSFQPIISYGAKSIYGYEALLRTHDEIFPTPAALLAAANKLDRIHEVGRIARQLAVQAFARAPGHTRLFLNLHAKELHDPQLYSINDPICSIAPRVVLEITERSALDGVNDAKKRIRLLRSHGYSLAVDDLGSGYSGLTSFNLLKPELAKLDVSLIRGIEKSKTQQRVVQTIVGISRELGFEVVAEGIETRAERDLAVNLGCDLLQGYLFARPGPAFPQAQFD